MNHSSNRTSFPKICDSSPADNMDATDSDSNNDSMKTETLPTQSQRRTKGQPPELKLLCSLCTPEKPEDCTFVDLKQKLDEQFGVKKLVLLERYNFYRYRQSEDQSLTEYLLELQRLSLSCEWPEA